MQPHKELLSSFGVAHTPKHKSTRGVLKSPLLSLILGPTPDIVTSQTFLISEYRNGFTASLGRNERGAAVGSLLALAHLGDSRAMPPAPATPGVFLEAFPLPKSSPSPSLWLWIPRGSVGSARRDWCHSRTLRVLSQISALSCDCPWISAQPGCRSGWWL